MDSQMTAQHRGRPLMTWVEVTDAAGGTRLESRWSLPSHATNATHAA